jgi:hypothetical protein
VKCSGLVVAVLVVASTAYADPTKDECVNANEAAQSLRTAGKLRDARAKLSVCVAKSCPGPVRDDCSERLNDLLKALPSMVFDVHAVSGADMRNVQVKMDGAVLATRLDGSSIPVDPGQHTFTFEADGFAVLDVPLLIREGDKSRHEPLVMKPGHAMGATPSGDAAALPDITQTGEGHANAGDSKSGIRTGAYAALGVGAAGIVIGSIFGAMALGDKSSLSSHCSGDACPPSEQSDISGLRSNGTVSDVGFAFGIAGLAAGVVMLVLSRHGEAAASNETPTAWIGFGRAGVEARF